MMGAFSARAFSSDAFLTQFMRRDRCSAAAVPDLPSAWLAWPLPSAGYVCPQVARLALLRGAAWSCDGGALVIGGARLMGEAGGDFGFSTAATGARWVQIQGEREGADLSLAAELAGADLTAWKAAKAKTLADYARRVIDRAANMADPDKRAAMVAESEWCLNKWI